MVSCQEMGIILENKEILELMSSKNVLRNLYSLTKKKMRRIWSIGFESQNFAVFDLQFKNDRKAQKILMAVFFVI